MSDNLSSAYLILLVEGEEDGLLIKSWLEEKSPKIKRAFHNALFAIDHLGGATNLSYKASLYKNNLCQVVGFLDNDEAGRKGVLDAVDKNIIKPTDYCLTSCPGMKNSEIEDLLNLSSYRDLILSNYGVDLKVAPFRNNKAQWSDRVGRLFQSSGKLWNDRIEAKIKMEVSEAAAKVGLSSINVHKSGSIDALVKLLETYISGEA